MNIIQMYINELVNEQKTYTGHRNKVNNKKEVGKDVLNHLYICPKCNRVYKRYMPAGKVKSVVMYMDSSFPKRQDKAICSECKKGIK